jgi:hypothetical protein
MPLETAGSAVSLDLYVALVGHVVFLTVYVGWVLYVNQTGAEPDTESGGGDDA